MPVVSVLLPVRDAESTVEQAARSVLSQSERDLEVLAIDDGSRDGSRRVLERLATEDGRVRVLDGAGRGLVPALTLGLAKARAPFIARMDADDVALPERLRASLSTLEHDSRLAAVGTQVEIFADGAPLTGAMRAYQAWLNDLSTPEQIFADRLVESPLCHPSTLLRRSALEAVGGWRDEDVAEDWQLWLSLLEAGYALANVPQVLLRWRDHPGRLTRTDPRYGWAAMQKLRAGHLLRTVLAQAPSAQLWGAGETGLSLMRLLREGGVSTSRFIEVAPRKVGRRLEGIPVVPVEQLGAPGGPHLVVAVGARGARKQIRGQLTAAGWREGRDYTCAA